MTRFPVCEYRSPRRDVPIAADTLIPFGVLVGLDRNSQAVPAANVAGMSATVRPQATKRAAGRCGPPKVRGKYLRNRGVVREI